MPITPDQRHHYGKHWRALRRIVLVRAGHRCECTGECGDDHVHYDGHRACLALNGDHVVRPATGPTWWRHVCNGICCGENCNDSEPDGCRVVRVILTVAHLNHVAGDDRLENLKALCQRCHLRLDRHQHAASAKRTRAARSQQTALPLEGA